MNEIVNVLVPGEAPSTPNQRLHWAVRAKQTKSQRDRTRRRMPAIHLAITAPALVVRLTRIGKRRLDGDNCAAALKAHRDAVASWLRIDDASPLVRWEYAQETGEPGVRVEVLR